MMTRIVSLLAASLSLPLCATELTVNKPCPETLTGDQTLTVVNGATVGTAAVTVLEAKMTFSLPSETPAFSDVAGDKLAIAADTDGTLLVSNSTQWLKSSFKVTDGQTVTVRATGKQNTDGRLAFEVTFNGGTLTNVVAPVTGMTLNTIAFAGEGTTTELSLALVDTAIIPAPEGGTQDPTQVSKFVTWLNDETKGGAMPGASSAETSDAFAMNVGGTPSLTVTAIDPVARTITVKGSYTAQTSEVVADLKAINGVLTITSSETLGGTETISKVTISAGDGNLVKVTFPEAARFVKATVSVNAPANAETAPGAPVAE